MQKHTTLGGLGALIILLASASPGLADTLATPTLDPGVIDGDRPGGLDSGDDDWGRYEVSAAQPVSGLVRLGAHHARQWYSNPANPAVVFDISAYANDWDIEEMGLEIKADFVPGYYIRVRVCARSAGNTGAGGADDTLTISGASTHPELQITTIDPSGAGTCASFNMYRPAESGADEYTIMVRPLLQIVQTYWQYTIYGKVTVQYYPILQ